MKSLFYALAVLLLASCTQFDDSKIWDKLDELENRVERLEELCREMNTNIEALQTIVTALQQNDYITSVAPIMSGDEVVGYTITFAKSGAITIHNGKDGATPRVGVAKGNDGVYYWTVDGEWLLDGEGNKIQTEGQTPKLKIEEGYWHISYDGGKSWQQLDKATGEDGADSAIIKVEESVDSVTFTLADGTSITLPKSASSKTDICDLLEDVSFRAYCYEKFDANKDGVVSEIEAQGVLAIDITAKKMIVSLCGIEHFPNLESLDAYRATLLQRVDLSKNEKITAIAPQTFYDCESLEQVVLPATVKEIGDNAFDGCSALPSLVLVEGITSIGVSAFAGCSSLTDMALPQSLRTIGENALAKTGFTSIVIPEGVTTIPKEMCYNAFALTSVTFPSSVISIGSRVFDYCNKLAEVRCLATTPPSLGSYALPSVMSKGKIYVPANSVEAYKVAEGWSEFADVITAL